MGIVFMKFLKLLKEWPTILIFSCVVAIGLSITVIVEIYFLNLLSPLNYIEALLLTCIFSMVMFPINCFYYGGMLLYFLPKLPKRLWAWHSI